MIIDKGYWEDVIFKLTTKEKANWAAHVLFSNREVLNEILHAVGSEKVIASCLLCYSVDFSAQPYLDEILINFPIKELINVYKALNQKPLQTAGALMWLVGDIDPEFRVKDNIMENFLILCDRAKEKYTFSFEVNEIENLLLEILGYIKTYAEYNEKFSEYFIKRIKREECFPLEIILFCMRELKWLEIKKAAIAEKNKTNDWRIIKAMDQILAVYENDWEDADLYRFYSKQS